MKKIVYYFLGSLFILQQSNCPIATKSKHIISTKTVQANPKEQAIIEEIKSLLKSGKVPSLSFNEWVDSYNPSLLQSNKEPIRKLGETLQAIRQGNTAKISAFKVLPNFEKAVQEYDPKFRMSMLSKPIIIAKGTYWYFSAPKKIKSK